MPTIASWHVCDVRHQIAHVMNTTITVTTFHVAGIGKIVIGNVLPQLGSESVQFFR